MNPISLQQRRRDHPVPGCAFSSTEAQPLSQTALKIYESIRKKSSVLRKFYSQICFWIFQYCVNPYWCHFLEIYPTANASKVLLALMRQKEKKFSLGLMTKSISSTATNTFTWYCTYFFSIVFNTKVTHKHCFLPCKHRPYKQKLGNGVSFKVYIFSHFVLDSCKELQD